MIKDIKSLITINDDDFDSFSHIKEIAAPLFEYVKFTRSGEFLISKKVGVIQTPDGFDNDDVNVIMPSGWIKPLRSMVEKMNMLGVRVYARPSHFLRYEFAYSMPNKVAIPSVLEMEIFKGIFKFSNDADASCVCCGLRLDENREEAERISISGFSMSVCRSCSVNEDLQNSLYELIEKQNEIAKGMKEDIAKTGTWLDKF